MTARRVLPFRVEVSYSRGWEAIAAFDCLPAARAYAVDCGAAHPLNGYRVTHGNKILDKVEPPNGE